MLKDRSRRPADRSRWERIVSRPVPLWALLLALWLGLIASILFGSLVRTAATSGRAGQIALQIATVPRTVRRMLHGHWPGEAFRPYYDGAYERLPNGFWRNGAQPFVDPGFVLLTAIDERRHRPVVRLLRLSDGRIVHEYRPDIDAINARSRFRSPLIDLSRDRGVGRNLMMHPLLMPDGGLVIHDSSPLARVDACGKVEWVVDGIFHHSMERDADGAIWAVYRYPVARQADVGPGFDDEAIAKVSPQGKPLLLRRIADILDANGLGEAWRGHPYVDDPFHLNDVQPILSDGRYWRRGDLLLSLRNMSMLLLYRPATGRVIWVRQGPWAMQHDVSVIDDHRISVFDNHWRFAAPEGEVDGANRIPVFDFATGRVSYPYAAGTQRNRIMTRAQGRATPLANGDMMIEETERGRLLRMAPDGTLRWRYISADPAMHRYQLRWSRYLDPHSDGAAIQAAEQARCA
jgi:hypothetical protein